MNLVIVESPAKAKTINKYLGKDYLVLASYGHIRDLPSKNGSVDPDNKFQMEWEIDSFSKKYLKEITNAAEDSDKIILATDPDREGEAIAWHVKEVLDKKKLLNGKHLERVVFNEITKKAILDAIKNPREIHLPLVEAYLARRALDYLVGFNISPILWTKLPGSKSAGRVQSVALKLITEREKEIELFNPEEYWTLTSDFTNKDNKNILSKLSLFNGEKIEKFSFKNKEAFLLEYRLALLRYLLKCSWSTLMISQSASVSKCLICLGVTIKSYALWLVTNKTPSLSYTYPLSGYIVTAFITLFSAEIL